MCFEAWKYEMGSTEWSNRLDHRVNAWTFCDVGFDGRSTSISVSGLSW